MAQLLIDGPPTRTPARVAELKTEPDASASMVSEYTAPTRQLPQMLVATTLVAVLPLVSSLALRASGVISSGWLSVAFAIALCLAMSAVGSAYWRKRGGSGEVLFSELLLWGWIRRRRQERELANATGLLQLVNPGREAALTVERRRIHQVRRLDPVQPIRHRPEPVRRRLRLAPDQHEPRRPRQPRLEHR